jgi:hypothetical protein
MTLEGWLLLRTGARCAAVLFHGHAASKDSELREARAFHAMGLNEFRHRRTLHFEFAGPARLPEGLEWHRFVPMAPSQNA